MSGDEPYNFVAGLEVYRDAIENIKNTAYAAAILPDGPRLTPEQVVVFRAKHWSTLWRAIIDIAEICEATPQAAVNAIKGEQ
ncbi:MAG TPA: hypothetical protein VJU59_23140 [Paraburkholderia sp.]|uniref:hypothetical protein n=1 Tax=Paraburkholderia sp. TaxID=1926495 RepID=UPI002B45F4F7|nr:hypothetical protein [Paraburkholderia sp.]HKR42529.1 hypothetical protein [Paraburkholderia sp.]